MITLALSKGRIFDETRPLLAAAVVHAALMTRAERRIRLAEDPAIERLLEGAQHDGRNQEQDIVEHVDQHGDFEQRGLETRAAAEIGAHRLGEFLAVVLDQRHRAADAPAARVLKAGVRGEK